MLRTLPNTLTFLALSLAAWVGCLAFVAAGWCVVRAVLALSLGVGW